ncbi:class I SAM-dependent methyltransferase [Parvibaculum sp.]|uniref:class I SAM-dependent methyltransferase n=1 Tax=Parvibaculum sp. TaxID=2024848 RepID=UPI002CCB1B9F|nr:class I SAM-dependent methyltransferase [Parvibaculum sp.]HUD51429.1 class I SAM-dependent methyltransferase [Parvibaculum sp.]
MSFTIRYDDNNQELMVAGSMSPQSAGELGELRKTFEKSARAVNGTLYLNVKRLIRLNNIAFHELAGLVTRACQEKPDLKISVVTSSVVGWSARKFSKLARISPNISVEQYDTQFYPGQDVLEDGGFIPILRTQTKMTWRHEREILPRHGLKPGMAVADVCCGIGDFAALIYKEFTPSRLVAIDHAKPSLAYARKVAADFGIKGIEYVYGDASQMLLEDNQFDFVTCRHSLQVFDRPELILKELFRICKPGGRVYITNEKNSHCLGEPRGESIQWTYTEVARLWDHFKMDIELGPKSRRYMMETGFEDIRMESFMVTNLDGDPQDFADVIQAWEDVYAGKMSVERGDSEEFNKKFRQGFQDHIFAALHPKGYAGWPIWVASGRKPA